MKKNHSKNFTKKVINSHFFWFNQRTKAKPYFHLHRKSLAKNFMMGEKKKYINNNIFLFQ